MVFSQVLETFFGQSCFFMALLLVLKPTSVNFRFLLSLCHEITLEPRTRWAPGHAQCCNTRLVPVSKRILLVSNSFEWQTFLKSLFPVLNEQ